MRFLVDTHVWLWTLVAPEKLSAKARRVVAEPRSEGWLSPISVWELQVLAQRGRVRLDDDPRRWLKEALHHTPFHEAPLVHEVALRSREVALPHDDPADRFLVATALVYDLTLITADADILASRACPVLAAT